MMNEEVAPFRHGESRNKRYVAEIRRQRRESLWKVVVPCGQNDLDVFFGQGFNAYIKHQIRISPRCDRPVAWVPAIEPDQRPLSAQVIPPSRQFRICALPEDRANILNFRVFWKRIRFGKANYQGYIPDGEFFCPAYKA